MRLGDSCRVDSDAPLDESLLLGDVVASLLDDVLLLGDAEEDSDACGDSGSEALVNRTRDKSFSCVSTSSCIKRAVSSSSFSSSLSFSFANDF